MKQRARFPFSAALMVWIVGATSLSGCLRRELRPQLPCAISAVSSEVSVGEVEKVDLLFVVDSSDSMIQEQQALKTELPRLVKVLATGDQDEDGNQDVPVVKDLRVGVITPNMAAGGTPQCAATVPGDGGRGLLRTKGSVDLVPPADPKNPPTCTAAGTTAGCGMGYGSNQTFVEFRPAEHTPATLTAAATAFADDVSCVAVTGCGGCGYENQLEAPLYAMTPGSSTETFRFDNGDTVTGGLGTMNNFVREDSLLVILIISDEDDCSAGDPELYNANSTIYRLPPTLNNLRCTHFPEALHPVSRYAQSFAALRPDAPDRMLFAAIVGVPADLIAQRTSVDDPIPPINYNSILNDDRMKIVENEDRNRLDSSCIVPNPDVPAVDRNFDNALVNAYPPRRIVGAAQLLEGQGVNVSVQSICNTVPAGSPREGQIDFRPALDEIVAKIGVLLGGQCLPRPLNPNVTGKVDCSVVEVLPAGKTCASQMDRGRTPALDQAGVPRTEVDGLGRTRELCEVVQLPAPATAAQQQDLEADHAPGWYYDAVSSSVQQSCSGEKKQRIAFVRDFEPSAGTRVRLECLQPVQNTNAGEAVNDIGGGCATPSETCDEGKNASNGQKCVRNLLCDPVSRSWQQPCDLDDDCDFGFSCDVNRPDRDGGPKVCVNPACGTT